MAYSDISLLSEDNDFIMRTRACVATQGVDDVVAWSQQYQWQMAAMPGFGDKYATALVNQVPRPGWDPSVISDGDILSAVQSIINGPPPPPPPVDPPGTVTSFVAKPNPMGPNRTPNVLSEIDLTGTGINATDEIVMVLANKSIVVAHTTNYNNPTTIIGYFSDDQLPDAASVTVALQNTAGVVGKGVTVPLGVTNPPGVITSIQPASINRNSGGNSATLVGTGFTSDQVPFVEWSDGTYHHWNQSTYQSTTQISGYIDDSAFPPVGVTATVVMQRGNYYGTGVPLAFV